tara:strand:+ start:151 stop:321 length:171 start_codon:yes stop_codon:yes gene_type:complete
MMPGFWLMTLASHVVPAFGTPMMKASTSLTQSSPLLKLAIQQHCGADRLYEKYGPW